MASRDDIVIEITPQVLLKAYTCGIFPMAESAEDPALYWIEPQHRGILPLDKVHVPRRLARTLRAAPYAVKIDTDIEGVIEGCAASRPGRRSTWINERIRGLYRDLFALGHCHTVEVWDGQASRRRALRRGAQRRLLRREHVLLRARRFEDRPRLPCRASGARRLPPARHAVRHRPPAPVRHRRAQSRGVPPAAGEGARHRGRFPRPAARCRRPT